MDNVKEHFMKLVEEFNLDFSECQSDMNMKYRTDFYAKYPGVAGFLIESYWDYDKCIRVATDCAGNKEEVYFYGNEAYYDYEAARQQVIKMIGEIKKLIVQSQIKKMEKDFK